LYKEGYFRGKYYKKREALDERIYSQFFVKFIAFISMYCIMSTLPLLVTEALGGDKGQAGY